MMFLNRSSTQTDVNNMLKISCRQMGVRKQQCRQRIILRTPKMLLHAVEYQASTQNETVFKNYATQSMHKRHEKNRLKSSPPSPNSFLKIILRENTLKRKETETFQSEALQLLKATVQSRLFPQNSFLQYMYPILHHSKTASVLRTILFI